MRPRLIFRDCVYSPTWIAAEAERIRAGRHALGCTQGDRIAVFLRNGPAYVVLVEACKHAGISLVSINWHYKVDETHHILADCDARALFIHEDFLAQVNAGIPPGVVVIDVPVGREWRNESQRIGPFWRASRRASGSTSNLALHDSL